MNRVYIRQQALSFAAILVTCLSVGQYAAAQTPVFVDWSTFLGGNNSEATIRMEVENGEVYVAGVTAATDFPTTTGALQTSIAGGVFDFTITKFDSDGDIVYSTYLGGSGTETVPDLQVLNGEVYLLGLSNSTDYPVTAGAVQSTLAGGNDFVLTKLDATGAIVYSTYLGGTLEESVPLLRVENGDMYLVGGTGSTDFPTSAGAYQPNYGGGLLDNTIAKIAANGSLVYSTYLGGGGGLPTFPPAVAVENGQLYIGSTEDGVDFPTTPGSEQPTNNGLFDCTISCFDTNGNIVFATYFGGSGSELFEQITVNNGIIYGTGRTILSPDLPVTADAYQQSPSDAGGTNIDMFYTQYDASGNLQYATFLGGTGVEFPGPVKVVGGQVYVVGNTASTDFPVTANASQPTHAGLNDYFIAIFAPGNTVTSATYLGGTGNEGVNSATFLSVEQSDGELYLAGRSNSTDFPVTGGAFQSASGGGQDFVLAKIGSSGSIAYSTYVGGAGNENQPIMRLDGGKVYLAGTAQVSSGDYPVTVGAAQTVHSTRDDAVVTVFDFCPEFTEDQTVSPSTQTTCQFGLAERIDAPAVDFDPADFPDISREGVVSSQAPQEYSFYQWQVADSPTGPWADIPAGVLEDYLPSVGGTDQYYRRVLDRPGCGASLISAVAAVLVNGDTAPSVDGGDPINICAGGSFPVMIGGAPTATDDGASLTYNWDNAAFLDDPTIANPTADVMASTIFTVTVTDDAGCEQIGQSVVNVVEADAGPDVGTCEGEGVRIGGAPLAGVAGVVYSWIPDDGTLSCTDCAQPTATPTMATTYTLSITIPLPGGGTCTTTDDVLVEPVSSPGTDIAGPDRVVCIGETADLGLPAVAGFSYTWAPGNYLVSNDMSTTTFQSGSTEFPIPNPITYQVTAERLGCVFSDEVEVAVIEARDDDDGCGPRRIGLPDRTPNIEETYTWEIVSGSGSFTGPTDIPVTTVSASPTDETLYRLTVSYNGTECIEEVLVPQCGGCGIDIEVEGPTGCASFEANGFRPLSLVATGGGGVDPSSTVVTWTPCEGLSTCTGRVVQLTDNVQRTYTATLTSTLDPSFTCFETIEVNNPAWIRPTFTAQDVLVCPGDMVEIGAPPVAGYTYEWVGPNDFMDASSNPTVTAPLPPGPDLYFVTVTDDFSGCTALDTATVEVQNVVADAGPDWVICDNAIIPLGTPDPSGGVWQYNWEPAASPWQNMTDENSPEPEVLVATGLTFALTVTDPVTGCQAFDDAEVVVEGTPMLDDAPDVSVCAGESVEIGVAELPGVTYSWSPADGLSCTTCAQPMANPTSTTLYTLTATFPGDCAVTDMVNVTVNDPSFDLGGDLTYCPSDGPINIGDNAPAGMDSYSWAPAAFLDATNIQNPEASPSSPLTYTLTVEDANGCEATDDIMVSPSNPAPDAGSDATICLDGSIALGNPGNTGSLTWSSASGTGDLSCTTCPDPTFTPSMAGTFTFTITQDVAGCINSDEVTVTVNEFSLPAISNPAPVCMGGCVEIGVPTQNGVTYTWSPQVGMSSPNSSLTLVCPTTTTEYTLVAVDNLTGCLATAIVTVGVVSEPAPDVVVPTVEVCLGRDGTFMPQVMPAGTYNYSWSPTVGISDRYSATPNVFGRELGQTTYFVEV
ncbi:MAG: hypothetical protein AAFN81_03410, partial [Bacteroidota bacterium]